MKQYWQKMSARTDALSLRERVLVFAAAATILLVLTQQLVLDPLFQRQQVLSEKIREDQAATAILEAQIQGIARAQTLDPDAANRLRVAALEQEADGLTERLHTLHKGLVAPADMPALLEAILKRHGGLRLQSLKTFAPENIVAAPAGPEAAKPSLAAGKVEKPAEPAAVVYKHGVEIVVQGSYLDMLGYMAELESMPWQVFWARGALQAGEYPSSRLVLHLYTLSLEKKWLNM